MPSLKFDDEAKADYEDAINYMLYTEGEEIAKALDQEIREKIKACQSNPHAYRTVLGDARRIGLNRFHKHYIAFALLDDCIYILAIGHASRREFFWRNRLMGMAKRSPDPISN